MDNLRLNLLLTLILLISFSPVNFGQTKETNESILSDQILKPVVQHILVVNFQPKAKKQIIYLFEKGLKKSWLPKIEGIEFQLLSAIELKKQREVYFFDQLKKLSKSEFQIGFAFGDPGCSFSGTYWYFDTSKKKLRFWRNGSTFGGGCVSGNGESHKN